MYFVHQVDGEHEETVFARGGALDALAELKAEGKIRFAGIASHYYDTLLRGAGDSRVDVLQGSGNLLERGMLDRIKEEPLFAEKGFLLNKVYAAGLLLAFFPVGQLIDMAVSYPLSSVLIGLGSREQVEAAMNREGSGACGEGGEHGISFEEVLTVLETVYDPIPCDRCQRCKCPWGTEIHTIFRQYQYYFLGKDYWALKKLGLGIEESAKHCQTCVQMPCLSMCPRNIRIPDEIRKVAELVRAHPIRRF